jgi:excisionase family DNA binding protein
MPDALPPLLVRMTEAARLLSCSEKTIQRLIRRGELPSVMVSDRPRVAVSDLKEWIEKTKAVND